MSETRIPKTEITGLFGAAAKRFSKKVLGEVPEQLEVMWHNKSVLMTMMGMSKKAKKWKECDENLEAFAHMATMALIGCRFCLDHAISWPTTRDSTWTRPARCHAGASRTSSPRSSVT